MKGIMIIFNQALSEEIIDLLDLMEIRGFTKLNDLQGRGSDTGEPRMGTHTWPALNNAIYTFVETEKAGNLIGELKKLNQQAEDQGLKAFSWDVDAVVV
ncbi:MAG: PG0541 family transporter-associated protein [Anditalea sp.]